jgi:ubiquinone/menaquinone biosynthesis C-methylase UbiE
MGAKDYPIRTSEDEFARLGMQAELFRRDSEFMLDRIGVEPGWRCLDLCCGTGGITDLLSRRIGLAGSVIGADMDPDKLAFARDWAAKNGLGNIRFVRSDAFATQLDAGSFDLVHCRFALSVIPNGLGILDHMLTLVRPGGTIFVEEVNIQTMECVPCNADWDQALALMSETFAQLGADLRMGPRLYGVFLEKGLTDPCIRPCLHALKAGDPMMMHLPSTVAAMRDSILSLRLLRPVELDELIERLRAYLAMPDTLTISYSMVQVVGKLPDSAR